MARMRNKLERRLSETLGLTSTEASRVAIEVLDIFHQTVDDFIVERHSELQAEGYDGRQIYNQLPEELKEWRFAAPEFSERQIRRRIYG
ncbi:MAG: hypothetical protein KC561_01190 [Myxococcales bacterium]|nr:hypothetical protein [Myxococcales bacterium]